MELESSDQDCFENEKCKMLMDFNFVSPYMSHKTLPITSIRHKTLYHSNKKAIHLLFTNMY